MSTAVSDIDRAPAPPVDQDGRPLVLLTIHAHPDDESSKGAGTVARYVLQGIRAVLVCCTGGEAGDILNPAMDRAEVRDRLAQVRAEELEDAAHIIGYDEVVMLGYRDSGMPDTEANADPRSFARADLDEAIGRLVAVIRRARPQVVVTYPEDQQGYPHPDHLRVHEITLPAVAAAADPAAHPGTGDPWKVSKVYYTAWSRGRIVAMHEKFLELGLESPFDANWLERPSSDGEITTRVDTKAVADVRRRALIAHATQVDPTSKFWFGLPPDVADLVYPMDEYVLARTSVESTIPEDDLFAGLRGS
ncbi:MAG: mycothiol conjugate amidase Mca [Acidimicrobiales bacterium]